MVQYTTIVSGLPRSGTSMMMRMLQAGGMEILTDNVRKADDDNPRGYFELEKVKQIKQDVTWLDNARGKAFKMVSQLLYDLPEDRQYRIIFMKRNMKEVLASQQKMLDNTGKQPASADEGKMQLLFQKHLAMVESWLKKQTNMQVLYVQYGEVIRDALRETERVRDFLERSLDTVKMAEVVEPALYRQRR